MNTHDKNQLAPSIEKLMHYLAIYGKNPTTVEVADGEEVIFKKTYPKAGIVAVSPTLYTRIDHCHGAGNCCRVPFDLVYTEFDLSRVRSYSHHDATEKFGLKSAEGFQRTRENLLASLQPLRLTLKVLRLGIWMERTSTIYVRRNRVINNLSGRKSCPYLLISDDRYFCGVHPFKPLHCWYPHMVVRVDEVTDPMRDSASVMIGRMQYGRNHFFGCPVVFTQSSSGRVEGIFDEPSLDVDPNYLDSQFEDDISKLEWTSNSAESIGFTPEVSFVSGIHSVLRSKREEIAGKLLSDERTTVVLWRNND
jgi:hypothetical protein